MSILVQKFGGTSVANAEKIRRAASRAIAAVRKGYQVVVVASARGHQTDELIADAMEVNPNPPKREMDQLLSTGEQQTVSLFAMALDAMGQPAISMTGGQVRMITDGVHTKARIKSIDGSRIQKHLDDGKIVIVAGFQGITDDMDVTTLGRGASDLSAVALAAVGRRDPHRGGLLLCHGLSWPVTWAGRLVAARESVPALFGGVWRRGLL